MKVVKWNFIGYKIIEELIFLDTTLTFHALKQVKVASGYGNL